MPDNFNPDRPSIVLNSPEIPGNTGSIGRTCVALDFNLILIKPMAFDISEKAVRRAGLDYWKFVRVSVYENFADFMQQLNPTQDQLFFFSKLAQNNYFKADYKTNSFLIFGSETMGLPQDLFAQYKDQFYFLPMFSNNIRSLNLANAATAVAYEVIRQTTP